MNAVEGNHDYEACIDNFGKSNNRNFKCGSQRLPYNIKSGSTIANWVLNHEIKEKKSSRYLEQ